MRATENTKTRTQTTINTAVASKLTTDEKINVSIVAAAFAGTVVIGLWSLAALVGGMIAAGGPLGLVKGYFQAFAGM